MNWTTVVANALVPIVSVISTAAVAIWTKRIDSRNRRDDRRHERVLDFEKRAADDKKAVLKSLISATMYVKRGAQYPGPGRLAGVDRRRAEAITELYEFRTRLGLDDGVAELMIYAAPPVREAADLLLDEWERQFLDRGHSLGELDSRKRQLAPQFPDGPPSDDGVDADADADGVGVSERMIAEEAAWLERLGRESDLDLDALVGLCDTILAAAHRDLRGGYGLEY